MDSVFKDTSGNFWDKLSERAEKIEQLKDNEEYLDETNFIFNSEDVLQAGSDLTKRFRKIFVEAKITSKQFDESLRIYAADKMGMTPSEVCTFRGNTQVRMMRVNITAATYYLVLTDILGLIVKDVTEVTFPDGTKKTIRV